MNLIASAIVVNVFSVITEYCCYDNHMPLTLSESFLSLLLYQTSYFAAYFGEIFEIRDFLLMLLFCYHMARSTLEIAVVDPCYERVMTSKYAS